MVIRKLFKVESAHRVPQCSSERCKFSVHGHSAVVEVFFEVDSLDNGMMGIDFGIMKGTIKDIVDSMDHSYLFWEKENEEYKNFFRKNSARYIEMPISASAEGLSLMYAFLIDKIVKKTQFVNGENTKFLKVRYHETTTGWAEADMVDVNAMWSWTLDDIFFSEQIRKEWKDPQMYEKLKEEGEGAKFLNVPVKITHGLLNNLREQWKPVLGHKKYEVSNFGKVREKETKKIIRGKLREDGKLYFEFKDAGSVFIEACFLVAKNFIPNWNLSRNVEPRNGDWLDIRVENLKWKK